MTDLKVLKTPKYNYVFNRKTGFFARWGETLEDNPEYSACGPEILDIEISTICHKGCNFCSPTGTKVNTQNGSKSIENIIVGDCVYSVGGNITNKPYLKYDEVKEVYARRYKGKLIKIITYNNEILQLTPDHLVLLKNGCRKKASDLVETDILFSINEFKKCKNCKKLIDYGKSYRRYYCSEECYKNKLTRKCIICEKIFIGNRKGQLICSNCIDWTGNSYHPLSNVYSSMIYRCYNPSRNNYKHYGMQNIKVCDRWLIFRNFVRDMGERPLGYTLDRIDNSGDYSPDNCRWVTIEEQRMNRRRFKNSKRKYKGVARYGKKWSCCVKYNNTHYFLRPFNTEIEAALAYNKKVQEFYPKTYKLYINNIDDEN